MGEQKFTDMTFLQGLTGGDQTKIQRYVKMFLQGAPGLIDDMKKALEAGDWETMRTAAHSLKPQCTYMGVKSAVPLLEQIEHLTGKQYNLEQLPALLSEVNEICDKAFGELEQL